MSEIGERLADRLGLHDGERLWDYESDPGAMMRVIEAMGRRGYRADMVLLAPHDCHATFDRCTRDSVPAGASAATLPRAVALAALQALEARS